jgi:hypothetical protein
VPLVPPVIVIHAALLVAVHAQLDPVMTLNEDERPVTGTDALVEPSEYVQEMPLCVTVNDRPPAVMTALR